MQIDRLSLFFAIALPLSALAGCPTLVEQTSRSDICSKHGLYINGSATSADGCFSVISENDCMPEKIQWEAAVTLDVQKIGLYVNAFDAYDVNGSFPRFALNITVPQHLHKPLWLMYEDFIKPQDAKCFTITKNNSESKCADVSLNYNCLVRDSASSLMTSDSYTTIRFLANGGKMQYKFRNLHSRDVDDGVIFFYSHLSQMNHLVITFQVIPGIDSYIVTFCYKGRIRCPKNFEVVLSDNSTYYIRYADLVTLEIQQATLEKGNYEVIIECGSLSNNTSGTVCCNQSRAFEINIAQQFDAVDIAMIVALILFITFCIISIIVLYLRQTVLKPIPSNFRMLLVFDAVSVSHTKYVKATRIFLRKLLGVEVLLDVADMDNKEGVSPYEWNIAAIERADCIAVVVPKKPDHSICRGSPYYKTYQLCQNMLASHIRRNKTMLSNRYLTLLLPDSDPEQIPPFSKFMVRFQIPVDYFFLRQHIQSIRSPYRLRLPRWLLFDQNTSNKLFFTILGYLEVGEEQVALIPGDRGDESVHTNHDCQSSLLSEELWAIQYRTEELDAIYGNQIPSVRNLVDVTHPTKFSVT